MRWQSLFLAVAATGCGHAAHTAAPIPTPIGVAPAYHPAPRAIPRDPQLTCSLSSSLHGRYAVHLELFANRLVVIVPAAIGVARPRESFGRVGGGVCRGELRTLDPTGTIVFDRTGLRLGDFFRAWGRRLSRTALLSFQGPVAVFVDGKRWSGPPGAVSLRHHAEIVVEVGGYVPPHAFYRFPKGF